MMVVVMTAIGCRISLMFTIRTRDLHILMVMVVSMSLCTFPAAYRCTTASTIIIAFTVIIFRLPAFSSWLCNWLWNMLVNNVFITSC